MVLIVEDLLDKVAGAVATLRLNTHNSRWDFHLRILNNSETRNHKVEVGWHPHFKAKPDRCLSQTLPIKLLEALRSRTRYLEPQT
jgi:hypothetical protein